MSWRALAAYDMPAVEKIAAAVHPGFHEATEVLAERQLLYHNGCYLLEIAERPVGYVLSHPWRSGSLPALNQLLGSLPANPDTYYLHDLALMPVARRIGAASQIVRALVKHAKASDFETMTLVAVNRSQGFWEKHGFEVSEAPGLAQKLKSYEADAKLMVKPLD